MQAIIFALISYFSWGTGIFFEAIVARKLNTSSLVFWGFLISFLLLSLYVPFVLSDLANLTFGLLIFTLVIGFAGIFLGTVFYFEALKTGNRVLVGTIASSFPVITVLLSIVFLGERIAFKQIIAILIIFIGLLLSTFNIKMLAKNRDRLFSRGVLLAWIPMFAWGFYLTFIKIPVSRIGWFWADYVNYLLFIPLLLFMKVRKIKIENPTKNNIFLPFLLSTILTRVADLSYNLGISNGLVTVVAPIAGANPTLFVILAFLFFKDPITKQQILGIITTLVGIVLLSIFSI